LILSRVSSMPGAKRCHLNHTGKIKASRIQRHWRDGGPSWQKIFCGDEVHPGMGLDSSGDEHMFFRGRSAVGGARLHWCRGHVTRQPREHRQSGRADVPNTTEQSGHGPTNAPLSPLAQDPEMYHRLVLNVKVPAAKMRGHRLIR